MTSVSFVMNNSAGGGPRNVYTLSKSLSEHGFESRVLSFNNIASGQIDDFGAHIVTPGTIQNLIDRILSKSNAVSWRSLPIFLFQENLTRPIIIKRFGASDVYISTFWQTVFPVESVAKKTGKSHLYYVQADETTFSKDPTYIKYARKTYEIPLVRFTQSKWLKQFLDENYDGLNVYIGFGINHSVFHSRNLQPENTIFTIARSNPDKGFHSFVEAVNLLWKQRKDFNVIIAGEKSAIEREKIDFNYEFRGWITDDNEIASLYSKSIFVNSGLKEALPMPPLEAMASGSAVVMTDTIGAREYTEDNTNCLLSTPGDYESIAVNIDSLLNSESLRKEISNNAIRTASNYNWEKVTNKLMELIEKVISGEVKP